jgi:hypothetical protein
VKAALWWPSQRCTWTAFAPWRNRTRRARVAERVERRPWHAGGYFTTRSDGADAFLARTSRIYLRADPGDTAVLNGNDAAERAALIERRLDEWKSLANS